MRGFKPSPQDPYRQATEQGVDNSLVVCDDSGHAKFPFPFVVLSWGELG